LKIGLNATCLNDRPSGARQRFVGIYGELVKRLPDGEFVIYEPADCKVAAWFEGASNVSARPTPLPSEGRLKRLALGLGYWHKALTRDQLDLFECFNQPLVKSPTGKTVLTIHDIRRLYADWGTLERSIYRLALERDLKTADHVLTVSESMKQEIHDFFPGVTISVVYNGLDAEVFDSVGEADLQALRSKHRLPKAFIMAVGHLERRKNYLRLIDAIARLRDQGTALNLVIVGNDSGERKAIQDRIASAKLSDNVIFLSGLSDVEVRGAYKLCSLFVFPSSYEGFGIPILEAMAAGCPMVLSDIPVFREITQNKGVYFPHDDVDAMAAAIDAVLSSSSQRTSLINYGKERVQAFSFKSLAGQLESVYRELVQ
jgi:glycosyltransferase involved in cell wall biosynthesis